MATSSPPPSATSPPDSSTPTPSTPTSPTSPQSSEEATPTHPPYWTHHGRTISNASTLASIPAQILLEDHSDAANELAQGCWAQSASVDGWVLVSGMTGVGAYVVWCCTVKTLEGGDLGLRKRYSEFDQLRTNLVRSFPHAEAMIPPLPRKSVVSRFRERFLEQRRSGLSHFLNCILLNPEFAASPVLKDFIFS